MNEIVDDIEETVGEDSLERFESMKMMPYMQEMMLRNAIMKFC